MTGLQTILYFLPIVIGIIMALTGLVLLAIVHLQRQEIKRLNSENLEEFDEIARLKRGC